MFLKAVESTLTEQHQSIFRPKMTSRRESEEKNEQSSKEKERGCCLLLTIESPKRNKFGSFSSVIVCQYAMNFTFAIVTVSKLFVF